MSELTYKKITDVEQVEALNDGATVFVNDNGAMKQVGADKFGAVKTVNGVEPDENGNIVVEVPEIPEPVQPDWNQNDPNAADYVKNRTHWAETTTVTFADNVTVEITDGQPTINPFAMNEIIEGQTYMVTWNGTTHECVAYIAEGPNSPSLGNATLAGIPSGGNGEPFFITLYEGTVMVFAAAGTHTMSIVADIETVHPIDPKFLPKHGFGYEEIKTVTLMADGDSITASENWVVDWNGTKNGMWKHVFVGANATVIYDGVEYKCKWEKVITPDRSLLVLGNQHPAGENLIDNGLPFSIGTLGDGISSPEAFFPLYMYCSVDGEHTISIQSEVKVAKLIDAEYMYDCVINIYDSQSKPNDIQWELADEPAGYVYEKLYPLLKKGKKPKVALHLVRGESPVTGNPFHVWREPYIIYTDNFETTDDVIVMYFLNTASETKRLCVFPTKYTN